MLRRTCALRQSPSTSLDKGAVSTITSYMESARFTSAFLRSASPDVYVHFNPTEQSSFRTWRVDGHCADRPMFSDCTYVLHSVAASGSQDRNHQGSQEEEEGCTILNLPKCRTIAEGSAFLDRLQKDCDTEEPRALSTCRSIVLQDFNPFAGNTLGLLLAPHSTIGTAVASNTNHNNKKGGLLKVHATPLMAAYLTDATFFEAVRAVLLANHPAVMRTEDLPFAGISPDQVEVLQPGAALEAGPGRVLQVTMGNTTKRRQRWATERPNALPHFLDETFPLYDRRMGTLFVGDAAGVRPLWWSHLNRSSNSGKRSTSILPVPSYLHRTSSGPMQSPLLSTWMPDEDLEVLLSVLESHVMLQRVCSTSYGELAIDVDDLATKLRASVATLTSLRKRLSTKLHSSSPPLSRQSQSLAAFVESMEKKLLSDVLMVEATSEPSIEGSDEQQESTTMRNAAMELFRDAWVRPVARALVETSSTLKEEVTAPRKDGSTTSAAKQKERKPAVGETSSSRDTQPALIKLLESRGLGGLVPTVRQETLDLDVFLAMSAAELKQTFRATFGLTKKLELLQQELKDQIKAL